MKLWIDDTREKPVDFDVQARSYDEAIDLLSSGEVTLVSLDYQLAESFDEPTGYDIACWLEEKALDKELAPISCRVHNAPPRVRDEMILRLRSAEHFWNQK